MNESDNSFDEQYKSGDENEKKLESA